MFFHYFKQILTPTECENLNQIMVKLYNERKLNYEGNDPHYKNSFGTGSIPEMDVLFQRFTPLVKEVFKTDSIKEENTYSRVYFNGAELNPHVDRPGLDLTMSLCTFNSIETPWPIFVELEPGKPQAIDIPPGDAALFLGTKMKHWRNPLTCPNNQFMLQSFFHWSIINN